MIEKYLENNREIKKEILKMTNGKEVELRINCYTSSDINNGIETVMTDLEVDIYADKSYINTVSCYGMESEGDFHDEMDKHRRELKTLKRKIYNYLRLHFGYVKFSDDYMQ